jgi:hypothetical protein
MFIYKVTIIPLNQVYIGLDTKPEYKMSRWKTHLKNSITNPKGKFHQAIHKYGSKNCVYEVIDSGFTSISQLALSEIKYIKHYDSYKNGLNSTPGGDGLNNDLTMFNDDEIEIIREALGEQWRVFNQKRWSNTTFEQRKEMIKHCHTNEANTNRSETLKRYYEYVPGSKDKHSAGIKKWREENPELVKHYSIQNGLKGAEKNSKKVTVLREDGSIEVYNSVSEFQRKTGQWMCTIREKSAIGLFHNGYFLKEINGKTF